MFVFPAFDSNYKTRKRTYKCCAYCRLKKIKCDVSSTDFKVDGCSSCKRNNLKCDLIQPKPAVSSATKERAASAVLASPPPSIQAHSPDARGSQSTFDSRPSTSQTPKPSIPVIKTATPIADAILYPLPPKYPHGMVSMSGNPPAAAAGDVQPGLRIPALLSASRLKPDLADPRRLPLQPQHKRPKTERVITAAYLKDTYNFNISGPDAESMYQYVFHDHPKAIIAQAAKSDQRIWHESGVYVDNEKKIRPSVGIYKPYKVKTFGKEGTDKVFEIKSLKFFEYLESIHAFSLRTPRYLTERNDIKDLVELYFCKINVTLPILHEERFWSDFNQDKAQSLVVFAIVLMIARDKMAEPILRRVFMRSRPFGSPELTQDDFNAEYVDFVQDLEHKIRQVQIIITELGDNDKLSRLIIAALLSMHFDFCRLGNEKSSQDVTDALNYSVSLGIHMKNIDPKRSKDDIDYLNNLWWVCYILDRVNALTNSRCIFIHRADFNIDLPYNHVNLLKMVHLATSLEHMLFSIYQPFNNNHDSFNDNPALRSDVFKAQEFQDNEFKICDEEISSGRVIYETTKGVTRIVDLQSPFNKYAANTIHFFTRLVSNAIILAAQKAKYDDPNIDNAIPEAIALKASMNIYFYVKQMKEDWMVNIPLLSWCISLGMSVVLKKYAKEVLGERVYLDNSTMYMWNNYMELLEEYSSKWWVVDEICKLSRDFSDRLKELSLERNGVGAEGNDTNTSNLFSGETEAESKQYEGYIQSMNIDLFDKDFFKGMPNVINFIAET